MKKSLALLSTVACLCVVGFSLPSKAATDEEVLRRLEAKIDALARENAALRQRVKRVESASRKSAQATPGTTATPKASTTEPNAVPALPPAALAANAAYYPVKGARPSRSPCANFGGWNVAANAGVATHTSTWNDLDDWIDNFAFDFNTSNPTKQKTGGTAGVSGGYNWQNGCTLFGVEIDTNWAFGLNDTTTATPFSGPATTLTIKDNVSWWGTARTRTGIVVDNVLLYLTGGLALAEIKHDWTVNDPVISRSEAFSAHKTRWGGVVGGGAEWAFSDQWSLRSEVLYLYFAEDHQSGFSPAGNQTVHFNTQDSMLVGRFAAVYRWGGTP